MKYTPKGEVYLANEDTFKDLIAKEQMDESKTRIFKKKELLMEDNSKTIDTIWVCFNKQ